MTNDYKTGEYVTHIVEGSQILDANASLEDEAVAKLKQLQQQACAVRNAMNFCAKYISVERLIMENLPLEATIAHAARHQCTMMDAREYVARRMAEGVDSEPKTSGVDP
jgi:hypothetical protein